VTIPHVISEGREDDPGQDYNNGERSRETEQPDWNAIFSAPDYTQLIRPRATATAREYTAKTNSLLKAMLIGAINAGDFPDAAAIIEFGPAFSHATGQLADADDKARKLIDMVTSPANPYVMFGLTVIPLVAQVFRNHETQVKDAPANFRLNRAQRKAMKQAQTAEPPRFTLKIGKRHIPIRFRVRLKVLTTVIGGVRSQTRDPANLTNQVFSNDKLIKALEKQGIILVRRSDETA
jgi:hypothetical protein